MAAQPSPPLGKSGRGPHKIPGMDAEAVIAAPPASVQDLIDYLPALSASSESTARSDLEQPDGSVVVLTSHNGEATLLEAVAPPDASTTTPGA